MSKKNIVIIGGGYAGIGLIPLLEKFLPNKTHRIILIEEQEFMYGKIGALRAAASEDIAEHVLVPYTRLFKSEETGMVVQASVTTIKGKSVIISRPHREFGSEIEFEYLVVATGSTWHEPVELNTVSRKEAIELLAKRRAEVARAKDIIIVGAGAVGIELSGEIKMAHPDKNITIIHGGKLPTSSIYPDHFREKILVTLKKYRVDIILNEQVDLSKMDGKTVHLSSGQIMNADVVFLATGGTPRGEIIQTLSPALYNPKTHSIKVKPTLQVADDQYPNIFAAGDVADNGDAKQAYKVGLHVPVIAKNIKSLIQGQTPSAVYKPTNGAEMIVLPMGKMGGISYLSFFGGMTLGDWFTKFVKGKTLFVSKQEAAVLRY